MQHNAPLARRTVIAASLATAATALAACSGGESKGAATSPSGGASAAAESSSAPIRLNAVPGFKDTPDWVSTSVPELAGWLPDPGACGVWYDDHAWVIVTQNGKSRALAIDTKAKKAVLSPDLPAAVRHMQSSAPASPWAIITTPSKALVLTTSTGLVKLAFSGDAITITPMPKNPAVTEKAAVWGGDAIVVVQANKTQAATGDTANGGNQLLPSYYLDPTAKKWVEMLPKRNGTVVGATTRGGKAVPVELVGENVWVGSQMFKSGFSKPQGVASAAGPLPFGSFVWSADGVLLMSVAKEDGGASFVRYGQDGKPLDGKGGIAAGTTWKPKNGEAILKPDGNLYAPTSGMLMRGIFLSQGSYDYELLNATVAPDGTLYANANPSPQSGVLPTSGSYVSATGELNANQHTDKNAPVVVTPDGAGIFASEPAWTVAAKA